MTTYRIGVLGIGGVGGIIGGKLAARYRESDNVNVIFIARGHNGSVLKREGLKMITAAGEQVVYPHNVSNLPGETGRLDLLLCCTKAYHLEESIQGLVSNIHEGTLVLPLLNGVNIYEKIKSIVPHAKVLQGCIYIVAKRTAPGVVMQSGENHALYFGGNEAPADELLHLEKRFVQAGIQAKYESNIMERIWSKFLFLSPLATYTSANEVSTGQILESEYHTQALKALMRELLQLTGMLHITLPADLIEKNFAMLAKLPYETTSSMQLDFASHRQTELETLTGFVVAKAREQHLNLSGYEQLYAKLSAS